MEHGHCHRCGISLPHGPNSAVRQLATTSQIFTSMFYIHVFLLVVALHTMYKCGHHLRYRSKHDTSHRGHMSAIAVSLSLHSYHSIHGHWVRDPSHQVRPVDLLTHFSEANPLEIHYTLNPVSQPAEAPLPQPVVTDRLSQLSQPRASLSPARAGRSVSATPGSTGARHAASVGGTGHVRSASPVRLQPAEVSPPPQYPYWGAQSPLRPLRPDELRQRQQAQQTSPTVPVSGAEFKGAPASPASTAADTIKNPSQHSGYKGTKSSPGGHVPEPFVTPHSARAPASSPTGRRPFSPPARRPPPPGPPPAPQDPLPAPHHSSRQGAHRHLMGSRDTSGDIDQRYRDAAR